MERQTRGNAYVARVICVLGAVLLAASCATPGSKGITSSAGKKRLVAHSIIYTRGLSTSVAEKVYNCEMELLTRSGLNSYRFSNYVSGLAKPDAVVTLAISGRSAGLGIYNANGEPLAEYPAGNVNGALVEFEVRQKDGIAKVKWFLGEGAILSVFESYDSAGNLGYSENTFYSSR